MSFDIFDLTDFLSGKPYAYLLLLIGSFIFTQGVRYIEMKGGFKRNGRKKSRKR